MVSGNIAIVHQEGEAVCQIEQHFCEDDEPLVNRKKDRRGEAHLGPNRHPLRMHTWFYFPKKSMHYAFLEVMHFAYINLLIPSRY